MVDLTQEFKAIQSKLDSLQKLADAQIQPAMKLKPYKDVNDSNYKWSRFDNTWGTFNLCLEYYFWRGDRWGNKVVTQESLEETLLRWDSVVAKWKDDNKEIFEYNQEVVKHNQLQYERVSKIMETLGVKTSFTRYYYKTSRSRNQTKETTAAKWPSEVRDALPMNCGYEDILKKIDTRREQIKVFGEKWIKDNEERLRKEAEDKAAKEKGQRKLKVMAGLCVKYNLPLEYEVDDILQAIIDQDKYLYLAHFMHLNRCDWSDGYDYAEVGINSFDVVIKEDSDIEDCILNIINGDDIDGRYFRDCEYNYDYLYSKVEESLLTDYHLINEFVEDNY